MKRATHTGPPRGHQTSNGPTAAATAPPQRVEHTKTINGGRSRPAKPTVLASIATTTAATSHVVPRKAATSSGPTRGAAGKPTGRVAVASSVASPIAVRSPRRVVEANTRTISPIIAGSPTPTRSPPAEMRLAHFHGEVGAPVVGPQRRIATPRSSATKLGAPFAWGDAHLARRRAPDNAGEATPPSLSRSGGGPTWVSATQMMAEGRVHRSLHAAMISARHAGRRASSDSASSLTLPRGGGEAWPHHFHHSRAGTSAFRQSPNPSDGVRTLEKTTDALTNPLGLSRNVLPSSQSTSPARFAHTGSSTDSAQKSGPDEPRRSGDTERFGSSGRAATSPVAKRRTTPEVWDDGPTHSAHDNSTEVSMQHSYDISSSNVGREEVLGADVAAEIRHEHSDLQHNLRRGSTLTQGWTTNDQLCGVRVLTISPDMLRTCCQVVEKAWGRLRAQRRAARQVRRERRCQRRMELIQRRVGRRAGTRPSDENHSEERRMRESHSGELRRSISHTLTGVVELPSTDADSPSISTTNTATPTHPPESRRRVMADTTKKGISTYKNTLQRSSQAKARTATATGEDLRIHTNTTYTPPPLHAPLTTTPLGAPSNMDLTSPVETTAGDTLDDSWASSTEFLSLAQLSPGPRNQQHGFSDLSLHSSLSMNSLSLRCSDDEEDADGDGSSSSSGCLSTTADDCRGDGDATALTDASLAALLATEAFMNHVETNLTSIFLTEEVGLHGGGTRMGESLPEEDGHPLFGESSSYSSVYAVQQPSTELVFAPGRLHPRAHRSTAEDAAANQCAAAAAEASSTNPIVEDSEALIQEGGSSGRTSTTSRRRRKAEACGAADPAAFDSTYLTLPYIGIELRRHVGGPMSGVGGGRGSRRTSREARETECPFSSNQAEKELETIGSLRIRRSMRRARECISPSPRVAELTTTTTSAAAQPDGAAPTSSVALPHITVAMAMPFISQGNIKEVVQEWVRSQRPTAVERETVIRSVIQSVLQRLLVLHREGRAHGSVYATNIFSLAHAAEAVRSVQNIADDDDDAVMMLSEYIIPSGNTATSREPTPPVVSLWSPSAIPSSPATPEHDLVQHMAGRQQPRYMAIPELQSLLRKRSSTNLLAAEPSIWAQRVVLVGEAYTRVETALLTAVAHEYCTHRAGAAKLKKQLIEEVLSAEDSGPPALRLFALKATQTTPAPELITPEPLHLLGSSDRPVSPTSDSPFRTLPNTMDPLSTLTLEADVWMVGLLALDLADSIPWWLSRQRDPLPYLARRPWSMRFAIFVERCIEANPAKRATVEELLNDPWFSSALVAGDGGVVETIVVPSGLSRSVGLGPTSANKRRDTAIHSEAQTHRSSDSRPLCYAAPVDVALHFAHLSREYLRRELSLLRTRTLSASLPLRPTSHVAGQLGATARSSLADSAPNTSPQMLQSCSFPTFVPSTSPLLLPTSASTTEVEQKSEDIMKYMHWIDLPDWLTATTTTSATSTPSHSQSSGTSWKAAGGGAHEKNEVCAPGPGSVALSAGAGKGGTPPSPVPAMPTTMDSRRRTVAGNDLPPPQPRATRQPLPDPTYTQRMLHAVIPYSEFWGFHSDDDELYGQRRLFTSTYLGLFAASLDACVEQMEATGPHSGTATMEEGSERSAARGEGIDVAAAADDLLQAFWDLSQRCPIAADLFCNACVRHMASLPGMAALAQPLLRSDATGESLAPKEGGGGGGGVGGAPPLTVVEAEPAMPVVKDANPSYIHRFLIGKWALAATKMLQTDEQSGRVS